MRATTTPHQQHDDDDDDVSAKGRVRRGCVCQQQHQRRRQPERFTCLLVGRVMAKPWRRRCFCSLAAFVWPPARLRTALDCPSSGNRSGRRAELLPLHVSSQRQSQTRATEQTLLERANICNTGCLYTGPAAWPPSISLVHSRVRPAPLKCYPINAVTNAVKCLEPYTRAPLHRPGYACRCSNHDQRKRNMTK